MDKINLKLAEYNLKTGKSKKFLELGNDFGYFGDHLIILNDEFLHHAGDGGSINFNKELLNQIANYQDAVSHETGCSTTFSIILKDEKDPLNRFDGLFNGRTYGKGRFVLINDNENDKK